MSRRLHRHRHWCHRFRRFHRQCRHRNHSQRRRRCRRHLHRHRRRRCRRRLKRNDGQVGREHVSFNDLNLHPELMCGRACL